MKATFFMLEKCRKRSDVIPVRVIISFCLPVKPIFG